MEGCMEQTDGRGEPILINNNNNKKNRWEAGASEDRETETETEEDEEEEEAVGEVGGAAGGLLKRQGGGW